MLSILIPIYNFKVIKLVNSLLAEVEKLEIDFEIICMDDHSTQKWKKANEPLTHMFKVNYVTLSENIGRAKIRNWLSKLARYEYLLFLDCDSKIIEKDFLKKYISEIREGYNVIFGGRNYTAKPPRTTKKMLHWKYGSKVESKSVDIRLKKPFLNFLSNNFLIKRTIILEHPFDEKIISYGYEDYIFAQRLKSSDISIHHIENPVLHKQLETNEKFLQKSRMALLNLIQLKSKYDISEVKVYGKYLQLNKLNLLPLFRWFYLKTEDKIVRNLHSGNPHIYWFQLWKLYQLSDIIYQSNKLSHFKQK